jgi:hypothetical protein
MFHRFAVVGGAAKNTKQSQWVQSNPGPFAS